MMWIYCCSVFKDAMLYCVWQDFCLVSHKLRSKTCKVTSIIFTGSWFSFFSNSNIFSMWKNLFFFFFLMKHTGYFINFIRPWFIWLLWLWILVYHTLTLQGLPYSLATASIMSCGCTECMSCNSHWNQYGLRLGACC